MAVSFWKRDFTISTSVLPMVAAGNHGTSHQSSETKKKNTLWLDGLRGYAAFIVFLGHFGSVYWHELAFVYGTQVPKGTTIPVWVPYGESTAGGKRIVDHSDQKNSYLLQLPILRLLYNGDAMVAFFFIISGYSLSIRPCTLIHQGRTAELLPAVSSAILRRPIRLLLPVVVSTFTIALLFSVGAFAPAMSIQNGPSQDFHECFHGYHKGNDFLVQPTFMAQMKHWFLSLNPLLEFFTQKRYPNSAYDGHVWTIPVEFRCSVLLYLTQMATALLDTRVRLTILGVLTIGAFTWGDAFEMALFWTGMSLCEINMTYRNTTGRRRHKTRKSMWLRGFGKISALFCGLYLASYPPVFPQYTPFYSTLASIKIPGASPTGQWRFWESVGTIMCAVLISDSLPAQKLLSNRVTRYLGRISFSLYLVHGAITRGFSQALSVALWRLIGKDTPMQYNTVVFLTFIPTVMLLFAASHGFCTLVDEPIVRFAKWLESKLKSFSRPQVEWEKLPSDDHEDEMVGVARHDSCYGLLETGNLQTHVRD